MNPEQLSSYFCLLDLPLHLDCSPHPANLALIQSRHLMRIPYQSRDLHNYKSQPRPSLALDDLLSTLSTCGGHCYQHSELLYAALTTLGYNVTRVASWVLNGRELRYPLRVSFTQSEEIECCEGERTVTRKETDRMFEELYTSKELIVIRDVKMCINLQTIDSRINFMSHGESHTLKVIKKGKTVEEEVFESQEEMFKRVRQLNVRALGP